MKSAIEIYKQAYELDYRKGDWEEAEDLYRQIVAKYPQSDEREYAEVHLERIQRLKSGDDEYDRLKPSRGTATSGAGSGFGIVAFLLCLILIGASAYFYYQFTEQRMRIQSQSQIMHGLYALESSGLKQAEVAFQAAQRVNPKEELTYKLLIDMYLRQNRIKSAEMELQKWKIASPRSVSISNFERKIQRAKVLP